MAQNITTLLDKTEITAAQIAAATSVINYLYLVHGTGSGRSRKISLDELKNVMSDLDDVVFDSITMQKPVTGGSAEVDFDGSKMLMKAVPASTTDTGEMEMTRLGMHFVTNPSAARQDDTAISSEGMTVSGVRDGQTKASSVKYDSVSTPHLVAVDADVTGDAHFSHLRIPQFDVSGDYNTQALELHSPILGEMVCVNNNASSSIEVIIGVVGSSTVQSKIITVNEGCSVLLRCTGTYTLQGVTYHSWTPVGNYTVSYHN